MVCKDDARDTVAGIVRIHSSVLADGPYNRSSGTPNKNSCWPIMEYAGCVLDMLTAGARRGPIE